MNIFITNNLKVNLQHNSLLTAHMNPSCIISLVNITFKILNYN